MNSVLFRITFCVSIVAVLAPIVRAQTSQPAALSADSSIDQVLHSLDARGRDLHALAASVKLTETDAALGDSSGRSGKFWLENRADGSTRAHILFDRKEVDGKATAEKIEYQLDGGKLIDRNYRGKKQVTRMVLKPGEKMNLLKLGEGPFPLPIGQKPDDVRAAFEVKKLDPGKDDLPDSLHLQLIPKDTTSLARKFKTIDLWIGLSDAMPHRIETLDSNETSIRRTDLTDVQINPKLADADFALEKIDESQWDLSEESYSDR